MPFSAFITPLPLKPAHPPPALTPRRAPPRARPATASAGNGTSLNGTSPDAPSRPSSISKASSPSQSSLHFSICKTVMPHDSDYSQSLWHGAYLRYLEEARVRYLAHLDVSYASLVTEHNTELVVRDLNITYLRAVKLGDQVTVTVKRDFGGSKLRLTLDSEFVVGGVVHATARVSLVPVLADVGKVTRKLPKILEEAMKMDVLERDG